ncbi:hypothetical protein C8J57DRAFT_1303852 [Mycena rebaudengoi]|nr:hypothetical protein C8J57DRAFT_1303852 [Mycena rebaudengoi]
MRFPQELLDTILDEVARLPVGDSSRSPEQWSVLDQRALRACSLTARSFQPRSQLHLFTRIGRRHHPKDLMKFDRLLAESPHIGKLVRYFTLDLKGNAPVQVYEKTIVVPRILRLLPSLTHLQFTLQCDSGHSWALQPDLLKTSIHAALSLHCLRNLCLTDMKFADVSELESLLSHAIGLKALTLNNIDFHESSAVGRVDVPREPHIVLESLRLDSMQYGVDTILSSFCIVDIKHLRSLVLVATPVLPLLKLNAQTLQQVRIAFADETPSDPDILQGNQTLRAIAVKDFDCASLQLFGSLRHLKELKTIFLSFGFQAARSNDDCWNFASWVNLNGLLAEAGEGLEDVFVSFSVSTRPPDMALVKQRLPAVAGKVSHKADTFRWNDMFGPHL